MGFVLLLPRGELLNTPLPGMIGTEIKSSDALVAVVLSFPLRAIRGRFRGCRIHDHHLR